MRNRVHVIQCTHIHISLSVHVYLYFIVYTVQHHIPNIPSGIALHISYQSLLHNIHQKEMCHVLTTTSVVKMPPPPSSKRHCIIRRNATSVVETPPLSSKRHSLCHRNATSSVVEMPPFLSSRLFPQPFSTSGYHQHN